LVFEAVRLADGGDGIPPHGFGVRLNHGERQAFIVVVRRDDAIAAIVGEKILPVFQAVVIDSARIAGIEPFQAEIEFAIVQQASPPWPYMPMAAR